MSQDPANPIVKQRSRNLSAKDREELDILDGIFNRIKSAVPAAPYILSTPSLNPYQHWSKQEAYSWMMGHLWDPSEEHLQYRTFLYREPYQDCFTLQPGEEDIPEERPQSRASNTSSQVPKKKISLSDYKSKQANGVITPGSKKQSPSLPPTMLSSTTLNGIKGAGKEAEPTPKKEEAHSNKRPAPDALVPEKHEKRRRDDRPSADTIIKGGSPAVKPAVDSSGPSNSTPHGLPPLMSPVPQSFGNPYDLPPILSPTLPSNILAELNRLETQRQRAESNASTSSSDKKSQLLPVPGADSLKVEEATKSTSRVRSVSANSKSPGPIDAHSPRLIVKLKYSKQKASTIAQLLRLPPSRKGQTSDKKERLDTPKERPVKTHSKEHDTIVTKSKETPKITARRPETSTPTTKPAQSATKVAEKRPRTDDDAHVDVPSKRPRAVSALDRPSTPAAQNNSSPVLSNKSSVQKTHGPYTTPRKDLKAISMIRSNSGEGYDSTPGRSGVTPSGSKHLDAKPPTSAPLSTKKQADMQALSQGSQKLNALGRSLKHEAQKIEAGKGKQLSKEDQKRVALMSLECILSYMAAYHAQDQSSQLRGRPCDFEGTWKTLHPLCMSYLGRTKGLPALDGLLKYLGSVISSAICTHVAQRARANAKAVDSPHDPTQAEPAPVNTKLLADHFMTLQRLQQDARIVLPVDDIQKTYPKTWAARETAIKMVKEPEKINGSNLSGPYFLPIQTDTTPIQAVRFGLKIMSEFCERERLDYSLRVNLERPE